MSCLAVTDKIIAVARGLAVDCYSNGIHTSINVTLDPKFQEDDIVDVILAGDSNTLALITTVSKRLVLFDLSGKEEPKSFELPRSASKIRFTEDNNQILVADKSGDVLIYDTKLVNSGRKLLGHLSLLLDVLQTPNEKFIITTDRDEKIRVSSYPNTYNIQTYCLGHREFVNHIEILPSNNKYLVSTSGDGTIKIWNYVSGEAYHTINTFNDVNEDELKKTFVKQMDEDGVEVETLPIVHFATTKLEETISLFAVAVHSYTKILLYSIKNNSNQFTSKLESNIALKNFPAAIRFSNENLYVYNDETSTVSCYKKDHEKISYQQDNSIEMLKDGIVNNVNKESSLNSIKVLYKRRFDNVQEYQERKKQRLEKSNKSIL